ncbi:hypothetical protein AnigIFM50267_007621 [Aspergillus niger]|nr:hypothetical protein AnigIFM50267_007621 [Aspergillus niger]
MRFTLLASMALLGLALAAATEPSTDDNGSTKVTDGTLDVIVANVANTTGNVVAETAATNAESSTMSAMAAVASDMTETVVENAW